MTNKIKAIAGLTAIFITGISVVSCSNKANDNAMVARSFTALSGEVTSTLNAYGRIRANRQVDLGSQASGQIQTIKVHIGEEVHRGQILAEIDASQLTLDLHHAQLAVNRSQLSVQARQSDYVFARTQLERETRLLAEEAIGRDVQERTQKNVADLENAEKQAEIDLAKARLDLDIAAKNVTKASIVAPFDGVILDLPAQEGQTLNATLQTPTVLKMAVLDTVTLRILVPEVDIEKVHIGQSVAFTSFATGSEKFNSTVATIYPVPEKIGNAMFFVVNIPYPNQARKFWPEMTVNAAFSGHSEKGIPIPIEFLGPRRPDGRYSVQVRHGAGKISQRFVDTGISDGKLICIRQGLSIGDEVVITQWRGDDRHP